MEYCDPSLDDFFPMDLDFDEPVVSMPSVSSVTSAGANSSLQHHQSQFRSGAEGAMANVGQPYADGFMLVGDLYCESGYTVTLRGERHRKVKPSVHPLTHECDGSGFEADNEGSPREHLYINSRRELTSQSLGLYMSDIFSIFSDDNSVKSENNPTGVIGEQGPNLIASQPALTTPPSTPAKNEAPQDWKSQRVSRPTRRYFGIEKLAKDSSQAEDDVPNTSRFILPTPISSRVMKTTTYSSCDDIMGFCSSPTPAPQSQRVSKAAEHPAHDTFDLDSAAVRRLKLNKIRPPTTAEETDLCKLVSSLPVPGYQGLFASLEEAENCLRTMKDLYRSPEKFCTTPKTDHSFPITEDDMIPYVRQVTEAILDWSSYIEWMQTVPKDVKNAHLAQLLLKIDEARVQARQRQGHKGHYVLTVADLLPSEYVKTHYLKDCSKQHTFVLGRRCTNLAAEVLSWKLIKACLGAQQGMGESVSWTATDGA